MQSPFLKYVHHGWRLIPIEVGDKSPRQRGWNREELTLSEPDDIEGVQAAGLAHAYSGTCAIDIDDIQSSLRYMQQFDIDLKEMYMAPSAVRILSGRKNRAKLIYKLPKPLQSIKIIDTVNGLQVNIIDFRCGTADGLTVQDALPPSIHPITKKPYYWSYGDDLVGDWENLPDLPENMLTFWISQIHERNTDKEKTDIAYSTEELVGLLENLDPDCDRDQWLRIGMAVHSASDGGRQGIEVWNDWSAKGEKYQGQKDIVTCWRSFHGSGITVDYLLMHQIADVEVFEDITDAVPQEKVKKRKKFRSILLSEWVKRPPPKWLIHNTLPQADLAMMYGAPGSGKSFFAMDLALCIATGRSWRDKDTEKGDVMWIAAEAAASMINRAKAYMLHHDVALTDSFRIIVETPDFNMVEHIREIGLEAKKYRPVLIIVDTLTAAAGGANENSGQDMAKILAACRALHAASRALILLIHHSGKDASKGARGWSGLRAAMQTEIEMDQLANGERIAKIAKQRDGEQDIEFPFRLLSVDLPDVDGVSQTSCVVESEETGFEEELIEESEGGSYVALTDLENGEDHLGIAAFKNVLEELEDDTETSITLQHFRESGHYDVSDTKIKLSTCREIVDEKF